MPKTPIEDLSKHLEKELQDYFNITVNSDTTINVYPQDDSLSVHFLKQNGKTLVRLKMSFEAGDRLFEGLKEFLGKVS